MSQSKLVEALKDLIIICDSTSAMKDTDVLTKAKQALSQAQSKQKEHDLSVHGVALEKDGKRIDPKDFYKPAPPTQEEVSEADKEEIRNIVWKWFVDKSESRNRWIDMIIQDLIAAGWRKQWQNSAPIATSQCPKMISIVSAKSIIRWEEYDLFMRI